MPSVPMDEALTSSFIFLGLLVFCHAQTCDNSCKMPKLDPCQKAAIRENKDFIDTLTTENVESFNVDFYREPIMVLSNSQHVFVKKYFRNFFIPTKEVFTVERNKAVQVPPSRDGTYVDHNITNGVTVDTNGTCTTVTRTSSLGNGMTSIMTTTKCQGTDAYGRRWMKQQSHTKHVNRRNKRQTTTLPPTPICIGQPPAVERVLFSVESVTGEAVQLVPIPGSTQNQGDADCIVSAAADSSISCQRVLLDVPTISFRLRRKKLDVLNVKLPRCVAFMSFN